MTAPPLDGAETTDDPIGWFRRTLDRARASETFDATRAALATTGADGRPNVRFVLVKDADEAGFVFYTNLGSAKARDLAATPHAALAFHWSTLGVQVRVSGRVERTSDAEADAYFATRARGSQIGAWASEQSRPIADRATLEARCAEVARRFEGVQVPRPPHWGGFRIVPTTLEVWQQHEDRLHDRWCFTRSNETQRWTMQRLQP